MMESVHKQVKIWHRKQKVWMKHLDRVEKNLNKYIEEKGEGSFFEKKTKALLRDADNYLEATDELVKLLFTARRIFLNDPKTVPDYEEVIQRQAEIIKSQNECLRAYGIDPNIARWGGSIGKRKIRTHQARVSY